MGLIKRFLSTCQLLFTICIKGCYRKFDKTNRV